MKKYLLSVVVVAGLMGPSYMQAKDVLQQERELHERTQALREGGYKSAAKRGALVGAAIGARIGYGQRTDADYSEAKRVAGTGDPFGAAAEAGVARAGKAAKTVGKTSRGAAIGATVGAAIAVAVRSGLRQWQLRKINSVLEDRTGYPEFKDLTQEQAMLIVAAYKRNIPMMKRLINRMPSFAGQKGIWQALTELFYDKKPTSSRVDQLKEVIAVS